MPIKQGHLAVVEINQGSETVTRYMDIARKLVLKRVNLWTIRENEPEKVYQDSEYVRHLMFAYRQKRKVPPIEVVRTSLKYGTWFLLIDGHNRFEAAKQAGLVSLDVLELHPTDVFYEKLRYDF